MFFKLGDRGKNWDSELGIFCRLRKFFRNIIFYVFIVTMEVDVVVLTDIGRILSELCLVF